MRALSFRTFCPYNSRHGEPAVFIRSEQVHDRLLAHIPMETAMLRKWLKAGFMEKHTTWRVIAYEGEIEEDREKRPGLSRVTSVSSPRAIAGCCQLSGSPEKALMPDGQSCLDSL